jgi:hypothetical protein
VAPLKQRKCEGVADLPKSHKAESCLAIAVCIERIALFVPAHARPQASD